MVNRIFGITLFVVIFFLCSTSSTAIAQAPHEVNIFDAQLDRLDNLAEEISATQQAHFPPRSANDKAVHDLLQFALVEVMAASREVFFLQQMIEMQNLAKDGARDYALRLVKLQKSYIQKKFPPNANRISLLAMEAKKSQSMLVVEKLQKAEGALRSAVALTR